MKKQFFGTLFAGVIIVLFCITGFATGKDTNCDVVYDYSNEQVTISGVTEKENDLNGIVTIQVLKGGNTFDGLNTKSIEEKKESILFTGQENTAGSNGEFSFTIGYNETDMPEGNATSVPHKVRIVTNNGTKVLDFTINLSTKKVYAMAVDKINNIASDITKTDEEFAKALQTELMSLGFDAEPLDKSALSEVLTKPYRTYIAKNHIDVEKMPENSRVFKNFILMGASKTNNLKNLEDYKNTIFWTEDGLSLAYDNVAKNQVIQEYFTKKFTDEIIASEDITLDTFTKAWKVAVILTNARYGSGWGSLKASLDVYGSEIGITQNKSNSVYQNLFGKDYTKNSLKYAFDTAEDKNSTGSSSGGGGGGGNSNVSLNKIAAGNNNIITSDTTEKITPIKKNFWDIDDAEWAAEAILALADKGIIHGKEENVFKPNDAVTREEFIKILIGAMNLSDERYINHFEDVNSSDWFCSWVNIAYENGVCQGIGRNCFGVGSQITRQDMVVMLNNALRMKGKTLPDIENLTFLDKNEIAEYARIPVSNMVYIGAVNGVSDTEFEPLGIANRAQAASIIYRVLEELQ